MSQPTDSTKNTSVSGPESPTTARPLEMDDDDVQDTSVLGTTNQTPTTTAPAAGTNNTTATSDEVAPPKPPRPVSEEAQHRQMLKEAFPSIDDAVIRAVLTASGGRVEPAFNALLEMTDPDAAQHERPPPQPPRPVQAPLPASATPQDQLDADEQYARQLAQHYENVGAYEQRTSSRQYGGSGAPRRQQTGLAPRRGSDDSDRERSFINDDLPEIQETLRKGFVETQTKVNTWFTALKKRIDEEFNDNDGQNQAQQGGRNAFMGRPSRDNTRRSGDYDRYDADPELLSDDFAGMRFNSDGTPARNQRGAANPNLFKPPPPSSSPKPGGERKVSFRDGADEIDMYGGPHSPQVPPKDGQTSGVTSPVPGAGGSATKASKWQPLSTVEPNPIAENDPFSLGDSEDEKDVKDKKTTGGGGSGEIKMDDAERLRQAAAEAMNDSLVDDKGAKPAKGGEAKKD